MASTAHTKKMPMYSAFAPAEFALQPKHEARVQHVLMAQHPAERSDMALVKGSNRHDIVRVSREVC